MARMKACPESKSDPFSPAREQFEMMIQRLTGGEQVRQTHGELETTIIEQGTELLRRLFQARLDVLFERERADLGKKRQIKVSKFASAHGSWRLSWDVCICAVMA